jgi:hypothetical protein
MEHYYWGLVVLFRRTALVAAWVFLADDRTARLGVVTLLNMLFLCLQLVMRPFGNVDDSSFEVISLAALTIVTNCLVMMR